MEEMAANGSSNISDFVEPQPPGTATLIMENLSEVPTEVSHFEPFDPAICSWRNYAERLQNHFELYDVPNNKRVRLLIDRIGNATYEQLRKLCAPDNPLTKTAEELFELLFSYFHPPTNKYMERVKFHRRVMRPDETIQEFADELRKMAEGCEFPEYWLSEALRTQFTHGVRNHELRNKLYQMEPIDFDQMLEFAATVKLPPSAPKKPHPTPPKAPKAAKVAKKAPPAQSPSAPTPKPAAPQAKKRVQAKQVKKNPPTKNAPQFKAPFNNQSRPQFRKNPPWQDYDDGYGSSYGNQYRNDYSNSNQKFVESTFKPNDSLFYRR